MVLPHPAHATRHVELIHLSDLHFGKKHQFTPPPTASGVASPTAGSVTLAESLLQDLLDPANEPARPEFSARIDPDGLDWNVPPMEKLLCLSGDFAFEASKKEFDQAVKFLKKFGEPPPKGLGLSRERVFVCPGNHDLDWDASEDSLRWGEYASFLSRVFSAQFDPEDAIHFGGVQVCKDLGVLVLSLNSEMEVRHAISKNDETRGDLSQEQLSWAKQQLDEIPEAERRQYIKIAMVHHHPILLPTLAEPERGYDAISGAQHLLTLLHKYGFHVLLHGHKHYPHTFHENVRNAFERSDRHDLVVVAGGSCGSWELPKKKEATQTYNRIRIHWDPTQGSTRVQVVTRGLVREDENGVDLLDSQWHWRTLATDDRSSLLGTRSRQLPPSAMRYLQPAPKGDPEHASRDQEYARTRGNFLVAEVRPSLLRRQINEVQLRVIQHHQADIPRGPNDDPVSVTWSSGWKFPKVHVTREEDPEFTAVCSYYGGALMRAIAEFPDGYRCDLFIYAPILPAEAVAPGPGAAHDGKDHPQLPESSNL